MPADKLYRYRNYLQLKNYRPATIKALLRTAQAYENHPDKDNYPKHLDQKNLNTNTRKLYYYQLKTYIRYLEQIENLNCTLPPRHYKKEDSPIHILTQEEVEELLTHTINLRDRLILLCLYHLGLRLGETARLTLEDIDLENSIVHIKKTKTRKQRQVPLNQKAKQILETYTHTRPSLNENLLTGIKGALTADGIYQALKKIVKRSQIKKRIYPHLLRHSIASHLLHRGMNIEHVSKFLGHASLESTQRYTHLKE